MEVVVHIEQRRRRNAGEVGVTLALAVLRAVRDIAEVTAAVLADERQLGLQATIQCRRQIQHAGRGQFLEATVSERELATELARRQRALDAEQTANGVATEQRSLRATQDFDAVSVGHLHQRAGVGGEINAIEVNSHGGVERLFDVVQLHATDGDGCRAIAQRGVDDEVGGQLGHALNVAGIRLLEGSGIQRGDRDGHLLHAFLALLRGDDDFSQQVR